MEVPLAVNVTLLGLNETVGQINTRLDEEIDALRLAVSERPFRLVNVTVEVLDEPRTIVMELGDAPMLKSGLGGGLDSFHAASGSSSQWFSSQFTNPWRSSDTVPDETYFAIVTLLPYETVEPQ